MTIWDLTFSSWWKKTVDFMECHFHSGIRKQKACLYKKLTGMRNNSRQVPENLNLISKTFKVSHTCCEYYTRFPSYLTSISSSCNSKSLPYIFVASFLNIVKEVTSYQCFRPEKYPAYTSRWNVSHFKNLKMIVTNKNVTNDELRAE